MVTKQGQAVHIFTDGGSRGNPGPSAAAAVAIRGGEEVESASKYLGHATNNVAEYEGLLLAFAVARKMGLRRVEIRSDSELLVRQWSGQYRVKNARLIPLFTKARKAAEAFEQVAVAHVRREQNVPADALVNETLDRAASGYAGSRESS